MNNFYPLHIFEVSSTFINVSIGKQWEDRFSATIVDRMSFFIIVNDTLVIKCDLERFSREVCSDRGHKLTVFVNFHCSGIATNGILNSIAIRGCVMSAAQTEYHFRCCVTAIRRNTANFVINFSYGAFTCRAHNVHFFRCNRQVHVAV